MNTSERWSPSKSPTSGVILVGMAAASAAVAAPSATGARRSGSCAAVGDGTASTCRYSRQQSRRPSLVGPETARVFTADLLLLQYHYKRIYGQSGYKKTHAQ